MSLKLTNLPKSATEREVKKAIALVVHDEDFIASLPSHIRKNGPLINFAVSLNPPDSGSFNNNGTGQAVFPHNDIASSLLRRSRREKGLKMKLDEGEPWEKTWKFYIEGFDSKVNHYQAESLAKTPYIDPDVEAERSDLVRRLSTRLRVSEVQIGGYTMDPKTRIRTFITSWKKHYDRYAAWLKFDHDSKAIHLQLEYADGNTMMQKILVLKYANTRKIGFGFDPFGGVYISFDNFTPPVLQETYLHPSLTGKQRIDNKGSRWLIDYLDPRHEAIAPFCPHLRILLFRTNSHGDQFADFRRLVKEAKIESLVFDLEACRLHPIIEEMPTVRGQPALLNSWAQLARKLKDMPFSIGFQIEALELNKVHEKVGSRFVIQLVRKFSKTMRTDFTKQGKPPADVFKDLKKKSFKAHPPRQDQDSKLFECHHVTCTPSRFILVGPNPTGFNRIIRKYRDYTDHFIRVDFRDEDGQYFRSSFEVDASTLVKTRIGGVLKGGITIAGRHFEFLAYSSSSMKVHSTWFLNPFEFKDRTGQRIRVTAQRIREDIIPDIPANVQLMRTPSKYAARIALAFTTSESVDGARLKRDEWVGPFPDIYPAVSHVKVRREEEQEEEGEGESDTDEEESADEYDPQFKMVKLPPFTDGVGSISKELNDRIWKEYYEKRGLEVHPNFYPSAWMLRMLGYKGVVAVDPEMEGPIHLRLRKSMHKFESLEDDLSQHSEVRIEIAEIYDKPGLCYLNRPLVMMFDLHDRPLEVFEELQRMAVADAMTIDASIDQFSRLMQMHGLGNPFKITYLLEHVEALGLSLEELDQVSPLWKALRDVAFKTVMAGIRYEARIPVPKSWVLVGVADEGPAYKGQPGYENVYCLPENCIFVCIQEDQDSEPEWLEGDCVVTRNPVVRPGDIQKVRAIGKPPRGVKCLFRDLKNVVVFSSQGRRSLPSCLAGGDLDGDKYAVIQYEGLLTETYRREADPDEAKDSKFKDKARKVKPEDICDFFVQYVNRDVLGLLSVKLLRMADHHRDPFNEKGYNQQGDDECSILAKLCSQAVDYPKKGIPIDLDNPEIERILRPKITHKPDWDRDGSSDMVDTIYYNSSRVLGHLYRSELFKGTDDPVNDAPTDGPSPVPYSDRLSLAIKEAVEAIFGQGFLPTVLSRLNDRVKEAFTHYAEELKYIRYAHSLSLRPDARLLEAEVISGTVLGRRDLKKLRKERISRMRDHIGSAASTVRLELMGGREDNRMETLERAWNAWGYSQEKFKEEGAHSFGLVALRVIFESLQALKGQYSPTTKN
ncbi:calcium:hydrogen antiporter [Coprinopsis cinerea AmutBmut pab1-1]|nr:calcium:hydrogen antiporter [Coprinopsis cinerea AmutBmut pab1-1]